MSTCQKETPGSRPDVVTEPYIGGSAADIVVHLEPDLIQSPDQLHRPAAQAHSEDVKTLQMMIQFATERESSPSITRVLNRMVQVRSVEPSARPTVCRFIFSESSHCVV
jgi:hypothetical protein